MKAKHLAIIGLVWTCTPFQDLIGLNTFRNNLTPYQAATAQVLQIPPPTIQCSTCETTWWPFMLEYQDTADRAALNSCGSLTSTSANSLRRALP